MEQQNKFRRLTTTGRILIFTPLIATAIEFIISLFTREEVIGVTTEGPTTVILQRNAANEVLTVILAAMFIAGLVILVYVASRMFFKGLRGEK